MKVFNKCALLIKNADSQLFFLFPFNIRSKTLSLQLGQMADQMRSLQLNALILLVIKLEEKHYDYTNRKQQVDMSSKRWDQRSNMAADSIRFIGGENKVYVHKTLL